jgi:hypothetical protein
MTAPAAIHLTYDSFSLQSTNLSVFFQIVVGFMEAPRVRGVDTVIPSLAGRAEGNRVNDILPILLAGQVTYDPDLSGSAAYADFWANMRAMRLLFAPDRLRADMVATLTDGTVWSISARPMNILQVQAVPDEFTEWSVEFEGYGDWEQVGT